VASHTESISVALERNWLMIDAAVEGMDEETLARRPNEECNSIAWLVWHFSRVLDTAIHTRIRQVPQLWIGDGWSGKFGMSDDPEDRGVGWTAERVAAWSPPAWDVQAGYYQVVREAVREFLATATTEQLEERRVFPPVAEPRSVAALLGQVTWDAIAHGGQIAYLRGLYRGMGWHV
jgi:hypothetical protein